MIHAYPGWAKKKGLRVCQAFAKGCGGLVVEPSPKQYLRPGTAAFYGAGAELAPLLEQCKAEGRTWFYLDNSYYLGRGKFFRATRNAMQCDGYGVASPERLKQFNVEVRPWRPTGAHVLICTQSTLWHQIHHGLDKHAWAEKVAAEIRWHTDRPIVICAKPDAADMAKDQAHSPALEQQLYGAWATVVHSSSAGVASLIAGVPLFTLTDCAMSRMARSDLSQIERPYRPHGREQWLAVLANSQWSLTEMEDGTCWRALQRQPATSSAVVLQKAAERLAPALSQLANE